MSLHVPVKVFVSKNAVVVVLDMVTSDGSPLSGIMVAVPPEPSSTSSSGMIMTVPVSAKADAGRNAAKSSRTQSRIKYCLCHKFFVLDILHPPLRFDFAYRLLYGLTPFRWFCSYGASSRLIRTLAVLTKPI